MQGNDISNAMPRRVLVTTDVITDEYESTRKVLKVIPVKAKKLEYNRLVLSHLYMYTTKREVTLELVDFTRSEEEVAKLMLHLDKIGTNPFRYGSSYKSVEKLVAELPFRPEVLGVIDIPSRQLRYGRWGLDFPSL
jgi:hypothetical protein